MIKTNLHVQDGNIIFNRVQDCAPILKDAAERRQNGVVGSSDFKHAASFPKVVVETYLNTHGITFEEFMGNTEHVKRMLKDPDLSGFRVWEGNI